MSDFKASKSPYKDRLYIKNYSVHFAYIQFLYINAISIKQLKNYFEGPKLNNF